MKQTIAQFLKVKDFPFVIKGKNGNEIYQENSNGFWTKREYDAQGDQIYVERSDGFWYKSDYKNGKEIYFENSIGFWTKHEYDEKGNEIYFEDSDGYIIDNRSKPVIEMTLQDIADKLGMDVKTIRIKD
jgi:hypothetical protein